MNYTLRFLFIYIIVIIFLFSFFISFNKEYKQQLKITDNKLSGVVYIQVIYHLGIDLVKLENLKFENANEKKINDFKEDIRTDIDALFSLQEYFTNFKIDSFNEELRNIKKLDYDDESYYEFLGSINQENYRVGDVARLLFDENREVYLLSSLLTHYMPEYLISILLSDSIVKEFVHHGKLNQNEKNIYIEQNKLVYLSSDELTKIIGFLTPSTEVKQLSNIMKNIVNKLDDLSKEKKYLSQWKINDDEIKRFSQISNEIIELSLKLNDKYIQILTKYLEDRKNTTEEKILTNKILTSITFLLITFISIYFYRIKLSDIDKEKEIKQINSELDKIALFYKTDPKGDITHISSALLKLSGYSREEVIGKNHNIFKYRNIDPSTYAKLWRTISKEKKTWQGELQNKRKDGNSYWIELTIQPELDENGKITAYSAHSIDISNTKKLETEKIKTQEALAFKSKFLSNMSHEIRTPINGIIGLIHVIQRTNLDEKQKDIITKVASSSEILLGIINDILDISKIEAGKMSIEKTSFNLELVIHTLESILHVKAVEKGLSMVTNYNNFDNFNFLGDSLRISQILNNLLSNAIKFTEQGEITINITTLKNSNILFEVKDTGIGLQPHVINKLFEEFMQADMGTSRKYGGTGLGLSISKRLVDLMDGKIWVTSTYGEGSTFCFELPLEADIQDEDKIIDKKINISDLEKDVNNLTDKKILVAEDNKVNQMVLSMLLEASSLNLDFANDGMVAVEKFRKNHYDIILMDIQMPNMNGYEATQKIREYNKGIPIIALSANVLQEDIKKAKESGVNDYLSKPIDLDKLYEVLIRYLTNT